METMQLTNAETDFTNVTEDQKEFSSNRTAQRKTLQQWGFEEAGVNRGDQYSLESHLRWIKAGHIIDEHYDANEELLRHKELEDKIVGKESDKRNKEKDEEHIRSVIIEEKQSQKRKHQAEIEFKKLQLIEGKIQSTYIPAHFWLYTSLSVVISIYLIFFYASAMNASFFRSLQQLVNSSSTDDITLMLNSIFDAKGIFQPSPHLLFIYLGAFLFFGFGILPHIFHDGSKYQGLKILASIAVCFAIDSLLAYKIDSGIHELKQMMNIADPSWAWFKSVNFYLVLAFGFGTYMLWGFIYEAAIKEYEKKNVTRKTEVEIKAIQKQMEVLEAEIINCKKEICNLQKIIESLKVEIESLKNDLQKALSKPEEILRSIENFYSGWLQYLNAFSETDPRRTGCDNIYRSFHQSISTQLN